MLYYIAKLIYMIIGWKIDKKKALDIWEKKNVLIPFLKRFVKEVDLEKNVVYLSEWEGLL